MDGKQNSKSKDLKKVETKENVIDNVTPINSTTEYGEHRGDDSIGSFNDLTLGLSETLHQGWVQERKLRSELKKIIERNEALESEVRNHQVMNKMMQEQLRTSNDRNEQLLKRYEHLFQSSQSAMEEFESQRTGLEIELEKSRQKIEGLSGQLASFVDSKNNESISREQYDTLLLEVQRREIELNSLLGSSRAELADLQRKLEDLNHDNASIQLDKAKAHAEMRSVAEIAVYQSMQLSGARDQLSSSIQIMESLMRSMKEKVNESTPKGPQHKVRSILIEQWKIEIDNLRKLDVLLADIIAAAKTLKKA